MTDDKIKKLPVWAQEHIKDLQRQRNEAINQLNEYCDDQTPTEISQDDFVCTGEKKGPSIKTRYIQGRSVRFALPNSTVIEACFERDGLSVRCIDGHLSINPQGANTIVVHGISWHENGER